MDETYYVIYDKKNDEYMSRTEYENEDDVDEDSWSFPQNADHYDDEDTARAAKAKYSNSQELIIVEIDVTYEFKELD